MVESPRLAFARAEEGAVSDVLEARVAKKGKKAGKGKKGKGKKGGKAVSKLSVYLLLSNILTSLGGWYCGGSWSGRGCWRGSGCDCHNSDCDGRPCCYCHSLRVFSSLIWLLDESQPGRSVQYHWLGHVLIDWTSLSFKEHQLVVRHADILLVD